MVNCPLIRPYFLGGGGGLGGGPLRFPWLWTGECFFLTGSNLFIEQQLDNWTRMISMIRQGLSKCCFALNIRRLKKTKQYIYIIFFGYMCYILYLFQPELPSSHMRLELWDLSKNTWLTSNWWVVFVRKAGVLVFPRGATTWFWWFSIPLFVFLPDCWFLPSEIGWFACIVFHRRYDFIIFKM